MIPTNLEAMAAMAVITPINTKGMRRMIITFKIIRIVIKVTPSPKKSVFHMS